MKHYILTESQLKTIINSTITEQQTSPLTNEDKIARAIRYASSVGGTNEEGFVKAIKSIKNAEQFRKVETALQKDPNSKGKGIEFYINDEFDAQDQKYITDIHNHFKNRHRTNYNQ